MAKHAQTRTLPTNCWSVFGQFVGLALKGLNNIYGYLIIISLFAVNSSSRVQRRSTNECCGMAKELKIGTEAYFEPSRTSRMELFCKNI